MVEIFYRKGIKKMKWITGSVMCVVLVCAVAAWSQNGNGHRNGGQNCGANCAQLQLPASATLSADEAKWLLYMREEEKLARDVYNELQKIYGLKIFGNIAVSEQRHFDSIGTLISRYGLTDPAQEPGIFLNGDIQQLYNTLIAKGNLSLKDALEVGVRIEETDIDDLETAMLATYRRDIDNVYSNLMAGSYNHLAAFESNLEMVNQ
jgi:hypothetical protein